VGDLTHASFFSGVGGTDLGLEAAGWRTISFSEIDPYANAVLAERWPGVPNLGDIAELAGADHGRRNQSRERGLDAKPRRRGQDQAPRSGAGDRSTGRPDVHAVCDDAAHGWTSATLWSGGFPCQDLSVAGKRAGFAGERSVLAFAFLDLVRQHRPPAVLLENVPGLLSSNGGRDFGRLIREMVELRYGVAYRILDARFFGVPQRRRRVFILAFDLERGLTADGAAEVLSVGSRCDRHPPTGQPTGPGAADGARIGLDIAGGLTRRYGKGVNTTADDGGIVISPPPDADRVREADGLAGRAHDRGDVARAIRANEGRSYDSAGRHGVGPVNLIAITSAEAADREDAGPTGKDINPGVTGVATTSADLLPLGLDSHRYRCCGNGVVAPVAEFIGERLAAVFA
jgi:site-specific DNA-cytosine methylase